MLRTLKFSLLGLFALLCSCNTIRDNDDHCGFYLQFLYDHNMTYECLFREHVSSVTVYVFDENDVLLFEKYALQSELIDGNMMYFNEGIKTGQYKILTVAGLCEHYSVVDASGSSCSAGTTTLSDVKLALNRESSEVSHQFASPVWLSDVVEATYPGYDTVVTTSLVRETNDFSISLYNTATSTRAGYVPYTVEIISPEGGVYAYNNTPLTREKTTYQPHTETTESEDNATVVDQLNTMRLLADDTDGYQLNVIKNATNEVVFTYDLMDLLRATKPTAPDGSVLDMQEYLDREYDWNIGLTFSDDASGFIGISLIVNGWIVWLNDIEI